MKLLDLANGQRAFFFLTNVLPNIDHPMVQVSRGDIVFSGFQVFHSIYQTILAFERSKNISKKFKIELLLRLSGQNQINKAIELLNPEKSDFYLVFGLLDKDLELPKLKELEPMPNEKALIEVYGTKNPRLIISKISCVSVR